MSWEEIKALFASMTLKKLLPAVGVLIIGIGAVKLLLKLFDRLLSRSRLEKTTFAIVKATVRVLLYSLVVLVTASSLGIDVTALVAVVSVVSLAISLAVQNVLANLVGGVTLLLSHPFRVGDYVQLGTDSGTVQEIGLHYTKIRTFDGELIFIPNSDTVSSRICNYSAEGMRRIELTLSAAYKEDIDKVKAAILSAAQNPLALQDPAPQVYLSQCSESSVDYLLLLWVKAEDYMTVKFAVTEAIKRKFDEENICIPYPQLDVHMTK